MLVKKDCNFFFLLEVCRMLVVIVCYLGMCKFIGLVVCLRSLRIFVCLKLFVIFFVVFFLKGLILFELFLVLILIL